MTEQLCLEECLFTCIDVGLFLNCFFFLVSVEIREDVNHALSVFEMYFAPMHN